jgi:hypothetical protein
LRRRRLTPCLFILEDDPERTRAMQAAAAAALAGWEVCVAASVAEVVNACQARWAAIRLMSLDHDLAPDPLHPETDPGDGRDFAVWLAAMPPAFPVVLHSSNGAGAAAMTETLAHAGWRTIRVVPAGTDWIQRDWIAAVSALARG